MAKLTVKDLFNAKGKRKLTQVFVHYAEEAKACEEAGIDMLMCSGGDQLRQIRAAAPGTFITSGLSYGHITSETDAIREGFEILRTGADAVYSCTSTTFIRAMAREGIPVVGHVGLVPQKSTWFGGFKPVGKTADEALKVYESALEHQDAGVIAVEMEVVPQKIAAEISKRLKILVVSMGSGAGCDIQYLYACDILGTRRNRVPRHSKIYRDLFTEMQRIQEIRLSAFREFKADVEGGVYPAEGHIVRVEDREYEKFLGRLPKG